MMRLSLYDLKKARQAQQLAKVAAAQAPQQTGVDFVSVIRVTSVWHQKIITEDSLSILCSAAAMHELKSRIADLTVYSHAGSGLFLHWVESTNKQRLADVVREVAKTKSNEDPSFKLPSGWSEELFFAEHIADAGAPRAFRLTPW